MISMCKLLSRLCNCASTARTGMHEGSITCNQYSTILGGSDSMMSSKHSVMVGASGICLAA
jgi:hypothetical protein